MVGEVKYIAGCQPKDSDGNDYMSPLPKGQRNYTYQVNFILPFYYGSLDDIDTLPDNFLSSLTKDLSNKGNKTYTYNPSTQHMCILYDKRYGAIKSILDTNNFELINGWSSKEVVVDGNAMTLMYSNGKVSGSGIKLTFKF